MGAGEVHVREKLLADAMRASHVAHTRRHIPNVIPPRSGLWKQFQEEDLGHPLHFSLSLQFSTFSPEHCPVYFKKRGSD